MKKQTVTTIAIVSTQPESSGCATTSAPAINWSTNVTISPTRNTPSRTVIHPSSCRRTSDNSEATTNSTPMAATVTDVQPIFSPGISANSDTASALMNAVSAADARMRCSCTPATSRASRSADTEIATNSNPISAPATPAVARKKSWMFSGTTRRSSQPGSVGVVASGELDPAEHPGARLGKRDGGARQRGLRAARFADARFLWGMTAPALDAVGDRARQSGKRVPGLITA
jgi:hypothetical protein